MTLLRTQTYSAIGLRLFLSYMMVLQIDISSAANGKLSTIPVGVPKTSQLRLPSDSRYRFDSLQFKGLAQLNSIRHLILGTSFCPGCQMVSSHHTSTSPHCQGTWHFACSKHRVSRNDNTTHFSPGHMSMKNNMTDQLYFLKISYH